MKRSVTQGRILRIFPDPEEFLTKTGWILQFLTPQVASLRSSRCQIPGLARACCGNPLSQKESEHKFQVFTAFVLQMMRFDLRPDNGAGTGARPELPAAQKIRNCAYLASLNPDTEWRTGEAPACSIPKISNCCVFSHFSKTRQFLHNVILSKMRLVKK